jgi:HD-like signal output (HDOD) protein
MSLIFRESRSGDGQSLVALEQTYFGITHGEAGGRLAHSWGLPLEIEAVMLHHDQPEYRGEHWMQTLLVGTAARLALALLRPDHEPVASTPELEVLGLDSGCIAQRLAQLADSMEALGEFAQRLK